MSCNGHLSGHLRSSCRRILASLAAIFLVTQYSVPVAQGHPQCLDYRPPFEPQEELSFCHEYSDFGCCSRERDAELNDRYREIVQESLNDGDFNVDECKSYLREILCQECSPYAAHVFDAEADRIPSPFPGLCPDYCGDFYDSCRQLVRYIADDERVTEPLDTSREAFCSSLTLGDPEYCYPDWNADEELVSELSRETRTDDGCLCLEPFADRLRNPLAFRAPPDDTDRLFIAEQVGVVHIFIRSNKTRLDQPFMDLTNLVLSSSRSGDERGFFNIAFHPDYAQNGRLFVYFSLGVDGEHRTRVSEFAVSSTNPNQVDDQSERMIIEIPQPYSNHNGGELLFGVDGYLYLFLGDGGAGGDPLRHGQDSTSLLGSILRLDIDHTSEGRNYSIPADNPFANETERRPEIFAYGVRNIWRCDVDEGDPVTGANRGRILCGDVGQSQYEEIDIIQNGKNYGWNIKEGFSCFRSANCDPEGAMTDPIYAYNHVVGKSVTGGHVYRGCQNPNLQGRYVFGDFFNGKIFVLTEGQNGTWTDKQVTMCGDDVCFNGLTNQYERNILSFGEDQDGEIYVLTTSFASSQSDSGAVYKLVDPRRSGDPATCRTYVAPSTVSTMDPTSELRTSTVDPTYETSAGMWDLMGNFTGATTETVINAACRLKLDLFFWTSLLCATVFACALQPFS